MEGMMEPQGRNKPRHSIRQNAPRAIGTFELSVAGVYMSSRAIYNKALGYIALGGGIAVVACCQYALDLYKHGKGLRATLLVAAAIALVRGWLLVADLYDANVRKMRASALTPDA
jgi:hypothetical protein